MGEKFLATFSNASESIIYLPLFSFALLITLMRNERKKSMDSGRVEWSNDIFMGTRILARERQIF